MTEQLKEFFVDHTAPDYYYIKKSEPFIDLGPAPNQEQLGALIQYCLENKNPLNLAVQGTGELTHGIVHPHDFYSWPIPMCFTWPEYRAGSVEGVTPYRLADQFWNNVASAKTDPLHPTGFTVFAAEIKLYPAGTSSYRVAENPGGPSSHRWWAGGSCRLMVPLMAGEGCKWTAGSLKAPTILNPVVNTIYEVNNNLPCKYINDSNVDMLFMTIDLCPNEKLVELEERILAHPVLSQLHVKFAAGFPVHPTVHL